MSLRGMCTHSLTRLFINTLRRDATLYKKWASVTQVQIISTFRWRCFPPRMQFISAYTKTALYNCVALKSIVIIFCLAQMKEILGCEFFCNIHGCLCLCFPCERKTRPTAWQTKQKVYFPLIISALSHTHILTDMYYYFVPPNITERQPAGLFIYMRAESASTRVCAAREAALLIGIARGNFPHREMAKNWFIVRALRSYIIVCAHGGNDTNYTFADDLCFLCRRASQIE